MILCYHNKFQKTEINNKGYCETFEEVFFTLYSNVIATVIASVYSGVSNISNFIS